MPLTVLGTVATLEAVPGVGAPVPTFVTLFRVLAGWLGWRTV